jgi:asparagine synthase (glutamine-hydrolysing)
LNISSSASKQASTIDSTASCVVSLPFSHPACRKQTCVASSFHVPPDCVIEDPIGYKVIESNVEMNIPLSHGIAHERLAIMDPESGSQPLVSPDESIIVAANGEIYNYKELYDELKHPYTPKTGSDCEVLLPLYEEYGPSVELPRLLRGMFSFILYDRRKDSFYIVRDHMGITPLYIGWGNDGSIYVASEMKSLIGECSKYQQFPPGHIYSSSGEHAGQFQRWYTPSWAPEMKPGVPLPKVKFQAVSCSLNILLLSCDVFTSRFLN